MSCFRKTKQGVVKIKELQTPSTIDILMEMQSLGTLSDTLSNCVEYLIDEENSAIPISVIQKSAMEKPANNPCISLPDVANQDTIRSFQAEFVNPKSSSKSTEIISSILMIGGEQNKGKGSGCTATGLTSLKTGLTGSSGVLQNKAKPKMVKPKKPEIGIWKTVEAKAVESIRRKSRSPFLESFRLNRKNKIMMLVGLKIPSKPNLFQNRNSMIGIGN